MHSRILVAGVGNIFLGDDGFGVEVAKRLASELLPDWVQVMDFGIRDIHLAYELFDQDSDTMILVDATPRGEEPGTVYCIRPDFDALESTAPSSSDAHGMNPEAVFGLLKSLEGAPQQVFIVGCEPARIEEEIGLSKPVTQAVDEAGQLILGLVRSQSDANAYGYMMYQK
jgi:hydrogenase maturation protease